MAKREFGGMITEIEDIKWEEHFEEIYDDGSSTVILQSKETFEHREDGLNFDYKYLIEIADLIEWGSESEDIVISVFLVPSLDSLHKEHREAVTFGLTEDDPVDYLDVYYGEGIGVPIGEKSTPREDIELLEIEGVVEVLKDISAVYKGLDNLRGFYLDRGWNKLGTTGWDSLQHYIHNKPLFKFL